jgi:hypothetical protein
MTNDLTQSEKPLAIALEDRYQSGMSNNKAPPEQMSMFGEFEQAAFDRKTAHLPDNYDAAIPHFRDLCRRFDAAILAADTSGFDAILHEADDLAIRLNGGTRFGIKADDHSPCNVLECETRASASETPIWGQAGEVIIEIAGCKVRAEVGGIYGIGFPSFSAHAIEWDKPFISETGCRSFLGYPSHFGGGVSVEDYVRSTLESYFRNTLKGRLVQIGARYREHSPP